MECKEVIKYIPGFLNGELEDEELSGFIDHVKNCADCEDELAISYLAVEGIIRLEDGASFNLDDELSDKLKEGERRLDFHGRVYDFLKVIELIGIIAMTISIVMIVW
ncbi:MAG TPA: hypothetical protein DCG85_01625 [Lachnospiraceae bacterium]|nr:hypothetical protein [Lachnospiraceae bacterium]